MSAEGIESLNSSVSSQYFTAKQRKLKEYLIGKEINLKNIDKSKQMIEKDFTPLTDVRASSTYRKLVSKNLMDRLFLEINNNKIRI